METKPDLSTKTAYIARERLLLLGALGLGLLFDLGAHSCDCRMDLLFGLFAAAYLALFYLLHWNRKNPLVNGAGETGPLYRNKTAGALALALLALAALHALRGCRYGDAFDANMLLGMNYLVLPLVAMVHMAFSTRDIPVGREWTAVGACLRGAFVEPFSAIPKFFGAIGSLFRREGHGKRAGVLIGLAVGLPLTALVLWLLASADAVMGRLLGDLFRHADVDEAARRCGLVFIVAMLFYSFYWNTAWGKRPALPGEKQRDWPDAAFLVIMGLLLAAYALFAYVQFTYLFGGRLPAGMTYSAYAREGFSQLVAVSVINFALLGAAYGKAPRTKPLIALTALMLLSNLVLLASAAMRLLLYTGAYGLTMLRVLPMWFMAYLAVLNALFAVRLAKEKTPLTRIAALTLVFWYVALNVPDWGAIMSAYNAGF